MKLNPVRILLFIIISFVSVLLFVMLSFSDGGSITDNSIIDFFIKKILFLPDVITSFIYGYIVQLKFIRSGEFLFVMQFIWAYFFAFLLEKMLTNIFEFFKKNPRIDNN
ncbi:hypothetical protein A3H53_04470 [Candidatus Nomurabacteria bacterium RIFCSPLOWO2_02_FULL_40_10]|uniref:Uncharacterized protein n=2 Tax=Candidatus Nomuraibacteriota TaxID=1752729 RepID=A0A1F6XXA5_9BACT|nr:MAG: hypothetical protein A2642_03970 [Candidatus Nomurabacteria bacterium RIFCSPHIGHO2_01_FULL_39_10]OGI98750.1 MAG: hypothetical protein A3H53_04470 [Candidatus Nomurabacteria bacterium RIFCSPLOWO2_02_FULL_40_10]